MNEFTTSLLPREASWTAPVLWRFENFFRMVGRTLVLIALALVFVAPSVHAHTFRAGAATSNISPWMGIAINGNMHNHIGTNLHDQLHARALVLDDGTNKLAIVVADSCMIYRQIFDNAKKIVHEKSGFPVENILMSATHTHSAPAAVSIFQTDADKEYQQFLTRRLADATLQAINNLQPAKIGWTVERDPRHVSNRRWYTKPGVINRNMFGGTDKVRMNPRPGSPDIVKPAGQTDPDLSVLAVKTLDDKPLALLANYSMHYVGDVGGNGIYSADYFGAFCSDVQHRFDPEGTNGFVAILSNGTSGDCSSTDFLHAPTPAPPFTRINAVAHDIADDAMKCFTRAEYHDWVPLKVVQKEITLAVRRASPKEVEAAKLRLAKAPHLSNGQLYPWSPDTYARETVLLNDFPAQVQIPLQALRIGDLGIVAIPCETFAETGLEIKAKSPMKQTFTIELANAYHGYIPTPAQHKLGGYETWRARSAYLEVDAAPKIVTAVIDLLQQVRQ